MPGVARNNGKMDNTHKFKPLAEAKAELEAAGLTPDKEILCYCGTSREGSLLRFYLRHDAGYPSVAVRGSLERIRLAEEQIAPGRNRIAQNP